MSNTETSTSTADIPVLPLPKLGAALAWLREWDASGAMQSLLQAEVQAQFDLLHQRQRDDTALRVARTEEERANGFATYLSAYDTRILNCLLHDCHRPFTRRLRTYLQEHSPLTKRQCVFLAEVLWEDVEPELRRMAHREVLIYSVRALALTWLSRKVDISLGVGIAQKGEGHWCVPVYRSRETSAITTVQLTLNGNILSDVEEIRSLTRPVS